MSGTVSDIVHIPQARAEQQRAADPSLSAFVSANAGCGKTTVLVDRVLRLLLEGAKPAKILCLTYTKAAAANMALKVFERLGAWVTQSDAELADTLAKLEGRPPAARRLVVARRLFAQAVETPGGLKIETIHAFCERILHLFPFEANVPARFEVLDETGAATLLAEATASVVAAAACGEDPTLAEALDLVSLEASGDAFDAAIQAAVREKAFLLACGNNGGVPVVMKTLAAALGLGPGETVASIEREMLEDGIAAEEWSAIAVVLNRGKATDQERAAALANAARETSPPSRLAFYRNVFLTDKGTARADNRFVTKAIDTALVERLRAERDRVVLLEGRLGAAAAVARTRALFTLADAVLGRVEAEKARRGALDFDDLIARTRSLFKRSDAAWVLYKLDAGIDHVLVDEAQDTNPAQWDILRALTVDFTAGAGARGALKRSIFAVGDPKQSIYGFQGADPREFEASGHYFRRLTLAAGERFESVKLRYSFRSAPAIVAAVDAVFAQPAHFRGLSFDADETSTQHDSARPAAYGRVDIWPLVRPARAAEPDAWALPVDEPEAGAPAVVLAGHIAHAVKGWTTTGDETGQVVAPGEILVLVRKRGALFEAVIRALKAAGVRVAGADRLKLGEHIAVMDLVALGRAVLLPDDDLSLAVALKSPLLGLDDDDLIRIGARRADTVSFAAALAAAAEAGDRRASAAHERMTSWRELARWLPPFGFYATLIGPHGGRLAIIRRLGTEAGDAIDEFLALAFTHERRETPSLGAFLAGFGDADHEVKRDLDAGRDEVRVMTVHGAKGLEASRVIVADGCRVDERSPLLIPVVTPASPGDAGGLTVPVWSPRKDDDPPAVAAAREALKARAMEEHNRLLYVALTRARDRLVIAPHIGKSQKEPPPECWLAMVTAGLGARDGKLTDLPFEGCEEPMRVWASGTPRPPPAPGTLAEAAPFSPPDWLTARLPAEPEAAPPLRPSSALGAADGKPRIGDGPFAADARLVGSLVHALIEHLPNVPAAARSAAARRFVAARAGHFDARKRERIVADALAVLEDPRLDALFSRTARAEAPIAGRLRFAPDAEPVAVSGQIDRLAVTAEAVLIADFKTTARPPAASADIPQSHISQLAVYRAILRHVFPDKPVRAFLVWTTGPVVLELPAERLDAALAKLMARGSGVHGTKAPTP